MCFHTIEDVGCILAVGVATNTLRLCLLSFEDMTIFLYVLEIGSDMQYATSTQAAIIGGDIIRIFAQMAAPGLVLRLCLIHTDKEGNR